MTQIDYLSVLLNDLGYGTRQQRNDFLTRYFRRPVRSLDELSASERSAAITSLRWMKNELKASASKQDDRENPWSVGGHEIE